jgi:quercetin dioxygenase-like cupin family protein
MDGITKAGEGIDGVTWNILGQTYRPVARTGNSFAFHTLFPDGTFVPPHVHPTQDEFVHVLSGRFDLMLDGRPATLEAGGTVQLPKGVPHGIFNKSGADVTALFWVSPSERLYELFTQLHNLADPAEVVRVAAEYNVNFLPPPPG